MFLATCLALEGNKQRRGLARGYKIVAKFNMADRGRMSRATKRKYSAFLMLIDLLTDDE